MQKVDPIYFDYQASTPVDSRVYAEMEPFFKEFFGNPHSSEHAAGWVAAKAVDKAAEQVAAIVGADADEIVFCSGATEANNLAILGVGRRNQKRKRVLLSAIEHKCVLEAARVLERDAGLSVEIIPVLPTGEVDLGWLRESIDEDVLLVSIMAVNNEIGTIQPLKGIGEIVANYGAFFHCDAAQAPCSIDIDVFDQKIDLLSLSGHKMYAPKGIGALYIRRELRGSVEPLIYGGGQQNGLRSGTVPVPLCVGLGVAAELLAGESIFEERARIRRQRDSFISSMQEIVPECKINGSAGQFRHPGNVNLCFSGIEAQDLLLSLQPMLHASTGSACNSGITEPSYVLRAIGLSDESARASVRFSIGRFTLDEEIERAVPLIADSVACLR